ncbi:hypothetical protein AAVH_36330 [Aphelenchoides avenae]|nr:hypothetical protein AAVH_36330 [Aphelenchus avenae]
MQPIFFTVSTISRQPRMLVFGLPSRTGHYPTAEDAAVRRNRHERIEGETVGSGTYVGNVEWTFTVLRLKELIQTLQDVMTRHFALVFHGQPMRDDKLLAEYPIEDESRLEMIVASAPIYP